MTGIEIQQLLRPFSCGPSDIHGRLEPWDAKAVAANAGGDRHRSELPELIAVTAVRLVCIF